MSQRDSQASWGIRLAAVAATLLVVVVVFAVKFSANGNEMQAVIRAAIPVAGGLAAAFLVGLVKKFAIGRIRWSVYLYTLLAIAAYLVVVEFL